MNFFSKLFSSSPSDDLSTQCNDNIIEYIKTLFEDCAEIFTNVPLFYQHQSQTVEYMMLHPKAGIILFNFFDYDIEELDDITVSAAKEGDKNPIIKTKDIKSLIERRLDEVYHAKVVPIHAILICNHLSEKEFDTLDESFHELIPKNSALFNDSDSTVYRQRILKDSDDDTANYELNTIKQAIFAELIVPEQNSLMSGEQQKVLHADLDKKSLIRGLPGSGKTSLLISKALYEKMKNPELRLIIFANRTCHVHHLQSMIFQFIENSHWALNPADIEVNNFDAMLKLSKEKAEYDLVMCDNVNPEDISTLDSLLSKEGKLLASSYYNIKDFNTFQLTDSYRLSPALYAACEGFKAQKLNEHLSLQNESSNTNVLSILKHLLKDVSAEEISIVHYNREEMLLLNTEINNTFNSSSYIFDDLDKKEGIILYPLSQLSCLLNEYMIIIIEDLNSCDWIELISRAKVKTFVLSQDREVYQLINLIKGKNNASH